MKLRQLMGRIQRAPTGARFWLYGPTQRRWIDLQSPHDIACREHRVRLHRPVFAFITADQCREHKVGGEYGCDVHEEASEQR